MKEMLKYLRKSDLILDFFITAVGAVISALALVVFVKPALIPLGGVNGIALILNYVWSVPIGTFSLIANIPLFLLGMKTLGVPFMLRTGFAVVVGSVFIDIFDVFLPFKYEGDILLACLFGGVIMGIGSGMVLTRGSTLGGTDILCKVLNYHFALPIGQSSLLISAVIILVSAIVYGNLESAMYAIILAYISTAVMDKLIHGVDLSIGTFIITEKPKEVSAALLHALPRGITSIQGEGVYASRSKTLLLCVTRRHETVAIKRILVRVDPDAFVMFTNMQEVFGRGFKQYDRNMIKQARAAMEKDDPAQETDGSPGFVRVSEDDIPQNGPEQAGAGGAAANAEDAEPQPFSDDGLPK